MTEEFVLPAWVDPIYWRGLPLVARMNGAQALLAMIGREGINDGDTFSASGTEMTMALMRGLPTKPPGFVMPKVWAETKRADRLAQAEALSHHATVEHSKMHTEELLRAAANRSCEHEWADTPINSARVCSKCGFVEALDGGMSSLPGAGVATDKRLEARGINLADLPAPVQIPKKRRG